MPSPLFDPAARALHRARASRRTRAPFLAGRIVEDLVERLHPIRRSFGTAVITGCPTGFQVALADVAGEVSFEPSIEALAAVEPGSLDLLLVIGELDLHDELPTLLRIAHSRLGAGALMAGALPGGNSLPLLRAALHAADGLDGRFAPRAHPRIEPGALAGLLTDAGFHEPVVDIDRVALRYSSFARLVADLRDHGATSCLTQRSRTGLGRQKRAIAEACFTQRGGEERIELLHFAGWGGKNVPHP